MTPPFGLHVAMSISDLIDWDRSRVLAPAITYIVMLPVAAFVYLATRSDNDLSAALGLIGSVLAVNLVLCIVIGTAAMVGAYVVFFVNSLSSWPNRLMKYGVDLIIFGFAGILLIGALDGAGVIELDGA